jgi:heme iron utilization protein
LPRIAGAFDSIERLADTLGHGALPSNALDNVRSGNPMHIPSQAPIDLLHRVPNGTLSTHSREPLGFPYPTALPFAPTSRHVPMLLVSCLAEHTRNLQADPRAGFLVAHSQESNVLEGQRLTLLGDFVPASAEQHTQLARRYLRYHPSAARYLELGDFSFWTMNVVRMRYIGGFGAMGWLDGDALDPLEPISADDELSLYEFADSHARRPASLFLSGLDRYGADLLIESTRNRFTFDQPKLTIDELTSALTDCFTHHQ